MPLGSSSAAPVMMPGPRRLKKPEKDTATELRKEAGPYGPYIDLALVKYQAVIHKTWFDSLCKSITAFDISIFNKEHFCAILSQIILKKHSETMVHVYSHSDTTQPLIVNCHFPFLSALAIPILYRNILTYAYTGIASSMPAPALSVAMAQLSSARLHQAGA